MEVRILEISFAIQKRLWTFMLNPGVQIDAPDFFFNLLSEGLWTLKGERPSESYTDYQLKN